jgi:hypothetical protein
VIWTRDGIVAVVHQYGDPNSGTIWNVLVYIYEQNYMGYLVNTGYVALNGPGTLGHGNFCWGNSSNSCLNSPLKFAINQTLIVKALNDGSFMVTSHQV